MVKVVREVGTCACAEAVDCTCGSGVLPLPPKRAERLAALFKALGDPTRIQLLTYIAATPGGTVCSCDLTGALGISQPTLSHHLKTLREAGLITRTQRGRWAHFAVVPEALDEARCFLQSPSALAPAGLAPASTCC